MPDPDHPLDSHRPETERDHASDGADRTAESNTAESNTAESSSNEPVVAEVSPQESPKSTKPATEKSQAQAPIPGPVLTEAHLRPPLKRRVRLPVILFVITCFSTFWAGVTGWQPLSFGGLDFRQLIIRNWDEGLTYMVCVLAILLTHEMGHFIATLLYRIPASLPFFIPLPLIAPIGTMGAVIGMEGQRANRRQIFDIGIAGPLAGLVVAIPILWIGISQLEFTKPAYGAFLYDCPLIVRWMIGWIQPEHAHVTTIGTSQLNAYFMAGWVGLLITGLNMMPVSQLDGGHVIYSLFLKRAHTIARTFVYLAMAYIVFGDAWIWSVMLILVVLMGTDHPPTADDRVPLGRGRFVLGCLSLAIPLLCFPLKGLIPVGF